MKFIPKDHWGIHLWGFIHTITIIDYDKIDDNILRNKHAIVVLKELKDCIPCPTCHDTYKEMLEKLDQIDLERPLGLFYWSVDLHNIVNNKLNKPTWTYEKALLKGSNAY